MSGTETRNVFCHVQQQKATNADISVSAAKAVTNAPKEDADSSSIVPSAAMFYTTTIWNIATVSLYVGRGHGVRITKTIYVRRRVDLRHKCFPLGRKVIYLNISSGLAPVRPSCGGI